MADRFYLWIVLSLVLSAPRAQAYTATVMSSGQPVRWSASPSLQMAFNTANASGLSDAQARDALVHALQRWQEASGGRVAFNVWSGTDRAVYEPNSAYNGLSSVYFASQGGQSLGSNILGVTQVWYDTDSGAIREVDTALNDRDFQFTTDPRDTTGSGSAHGPNGGARPRVYLENVITHEMGHAIGLSHSAALQSTMLYVEAPEQAHLGCDDQTAVRALYPAGDAGARGGVRGHIAGPSGAGVFGAHVLLISRARGTVVATAITNANGDYGVDALEAGVYFSMVEPFYAGASALPSYYAGSSAQVCGGQRFVRTPLLDASGFRLRPIAVLGGGQLAAVPAITVACSSSAAMADTSAAGGTRTPASYPLLFDAATDPAGFGGVDRFSFSGTRYYELRNVAGRLDLHAVSFSVYSPVRARVALYDAQGASVPQAQVSDSVYQGDSGYVNYDTRVTADNLAPGSYYMAVSSEAVASYLYPGGTASIDSVPYVMFTGTLNAGAPPLSGALAANARCRSPESFGAYQSPGGNPPRGEMDGGAGFCGTIERRSARESGRMRPPGATRAPVVVGWFLPWVAMLTLGRWLVRRPWRRMEE